MELETLMQFLQGETKARMLIDLENKGNAHLFAHARQLQEAKVTLFNDLLAHLGSQAKVDRYLAATRSEMGL